MRRIFARIASSAAALIVLSFAVFTLVALSPGDSSAYILPEDAGEEAVEAYREAQGLAKPFGIRYAVFLSSFLSGRWGETIAGSEVAGLIASRVPVTLSISLLSLVMSLAAAIVSSFASLARKTPASAAVTAFAALSASVPLFLSSMILILVFSVLLRLFPVAGYSPLSQGIGEWLGSIFLPSLAMAALHSSLFIMVFRKALRESMGSGYALYAASYGMARLDTAVHIAFRPALPVLVSVAAETTAAMLGGSAAIETVFALPGLGSLMVDAALSRDASLAGILVLLAAMATAAVSIVSELVIFLLDPRRTEAV